MQQFTDEQREEMFEAAMKRLESRYSGVDETDAIPFTENPLFFDLKDRPKMDVEDFEIAFNQMRLTDKIIRDRANAMLKEYDKSHKEAVLRYLEAINIENAEQRIEAKKLSMYDNGIIYLLDNEPFMIFQLVCITDFESPLDSSYKITSKWVSERYERPF